MVHLQALHSVLNENLKSVTYSVLLWDHRSPQIDFLQTELSKMIFLKKTRNQDTEFYKNRVLEVRLIQSDQQILVYSDSPDFRRIWPKRLENSDYNEFKHKIVGPQNVC